MKSTARKFGGPTKGKDVKNKTPHDFDGEEQEVEASSKGKSKKQVGGPVGATARKHGGRAARGSGGGCENSPFSSAKAGSPAPGRKVQQKD